MNFIGICQSTYNIIDQNHIDALHKKIYVKTDVSAIRQKWANRPGCPILEDRAIIHIIGRSNYSHLLDQYAKYNVQIKSQGYGKFRLVLVSATILSI